MRPVLGTALALALAGPASAETVSIAPLHDATLIQSTAPKGSGISDGIYAGRVATTGGGTRRRGLIAFDVTAAIPAGATIESATLALYVVQITSPAHPIRLHRTLASWSEGPTDAPGGQGLPAQTGDATWQHRSYSGLLWAVQGGELVAAPSASIAVDAADLAAILGSWGAAANAADLDAEGAVGAGDLAILLGAWTG